MKISARGATLATAMALVLGAFAAPFLESRAPLVGLCVRWFFAPVCHQRPERSFIVWGAPLAVCARCVGIYTGAALGGFLQFRAVAAIYVCGLAFALNSIDVASEVAGLHGNLPWLRLALGIVLGTGAGALLAGSSSGRLRNLTDEPVAAGASPSLPCETQSVLR